MWVWKSVPEVAKWASQIGDMIPQETVALIVHWLVVVLVYVLIIGGLCVLVLWGTKKLIKGYVHEGFTDNMSLAVCLVTLAISIFFADEIRAFLPINLLLLNIIVHALYVLIRWLVKEYRKTAGYY